MYQSGHYWYISTDKATIDPRVSDRLVGQVVKASASRADDPGLDSRLRPEDFSGSSHTNDWKIGTPVATLASVIGSALGLVGLVSVYCDWVR